MGNDYPGQEVAIAKIKGLDEDVKQLLCHHLRNALCGIIGGLQTGDIKMAEESAKHMKEDLERFGL